MKSARGSRHRRSGQFQFLTASSRPWYKRRPASGLQGERAYEWLKRGLDLALCTTSLPLVLPLLAVCGVAIWIDSPGPIFFTQQRTGKDGKRFRMFKLRTMVPDADAIKDRYRELNVLGYPDFKIKDDPRMTRTGKWLRRTSLDELPQVFNIIRGDMAIVGPRPTSFGANTYDPWQTARLEATPGLTGLWQVSGRNELGFDERSRLDIAYIRRRSLVLDIEIMFRTLGSVFTGRGAN